MAFPEKTFFWNPKWWKDLWKIQEKTTYHEKTGKTSWQAFCCNVCNRILNAWQEGNEYFLHCKNCNKKFNLK